MNPYKVLDIDLEATRPEILKAFRKKAREVHPDQNQSPEAGQEFQKLIKARDILLNDTEGTKPHRAAPAQKAHGNTQPQKKTSSEIKKEQELDQKVNEKKKLFQKESPDVKKHRKKMKIAKQRLSGKY